MKVAAKTRSAPESMKKNVERPRPVKPGEEMEKELEFVANLCCVQEQIMHFQHLGASSADPQQAPGRRKMTPHAETKVAVKTRSTPESMQKAVEGPCSVKKAEEMENEPEFGTNTLSVQELKNRFQPPSASSAAPQQAVPGARKMNPHAGHTVEINTMRAIESLRVELEKVLSDKLAVLQKQIEVSQHGALPQEELANTQTSLQAMSEKMQSLLTSLQNMETSRKQDLEILRGEMVGQIRKHMEAAKRSWTEGNQLEMDNKQGKTVDVNTKTALETMREEVERVLSEKLAVLQSQLEVSQHAAPPLEELANTQTSLQAIAEEMQSLMTSLQNVEASRKQDLETLKADMERQISKHLEAAKRSWTDESLLEMDNTKGHTVEINTTRAIESLRVELEKVLSDKLAVLQKQIEVSQHGALPQEELANTQTSLQAMSEKMQSLLTSLQNVEASRKQDLETLKADMERQISKHLEAAKRSWTDESLQEFVNKLELLHVQQYKVDVTLDADTAHPRLQVSEDGKSVTDTGAIRRVPVKKKRFDSHAFVLAKEGYTSGRLYWEVDVGKRRNWILGVAQETVTRKGEVVLSPQNGFWAIGLADGQEYGVHTDPWTRLTVSDRPRKIGIFLDISAKNLSFYNVHQKKVLYTFTFDSDRSRQARLFPFFSTGSTAIKADTEPLQIA